MMTMAMVMGWWWWRRWYCGDDTGDERVWCFRLWTDRVLFIRSMFGGRGLVHVRLPCQAPGVIGSALGLVGPVSVYCDWVRWKV